MRSSIRRALHLLHDTRASSQIRAQNLVCVSGVFPFRFAGCELDTRNAAAPLRDWDTHIFSARYEPAPSAPQFAAALDIEHRFLPTRRPRAVAEQSCTPLKLRHARHISDQPPEVDLKCAAHGEASVEYKIVPRQRGDVELGGTYARYQGPLRIAERWALAHTEQKICVYPNLEEARQHSVYLIRSRQIEMEKRHSRIRGSGREFESLREYREGDEVRDVCWTASARRGKLVTRVYQVERSQTIWLVVDA